MPFNPRKSTKKNEDGRDRGEAAVTIFQSAQHFSQAH
jgi:hypothetical protein